MKKVLTYVLPLIMAAAMVLSTSMVALAAPMPGAIWTTNPTGTTVNQNTYAYKTDVYLNGGPKSIGRMDKFSAVALGALMARSPRFR
jgi:hypothetical protein